MRKAVGPIIKGFAYLFLAALIGVAVMAATQPNTLGIPSEALVYIFIGYGLTGFLLFLLLFAQGQSVQALVKLTEQQEATHGTLKEIASLLHAQPRTDAYTSRSMFEPEAAAPRPAGDWRRSNSPQRPRQPAADAPPYARPPVADAPPSKPMGKVACSLCGNIQEAGLPACEHCGATFVTGASL